MIDDYKEFAAQVEKPWNTEEMRKEWTRQIGSNIIHLTWKACSITQLPNGSMYFTQRRAMAGNRGK